MFQPGANLYTQGFGSRPENVEVPHYDKRIPTTTDILYPIGKRWIYVGNSTWELLGLSTVSGITTANWVELSNSSGPVEAVVGTANEVTVTNTAGTATVSLPSGIITPGSLTTTTTLTAGTGLTVTTGGATVTAGGASISGTTNINTTTGSTTNIGTGGSGVVNLGNSTGDTNVIGNLNWASTFQGLIFTPTVASGGSPLSAVSRCFSATLTGVSIAAGATQSFTITNATIGGSSTLIQYTMYGATSGAALTIQSISNTTGQSVIVVTNGTGATTTTADITFIGLLLS